MTKTDAAVDAYEQLLREFSAEQSTDRWVDGDNVGALRPEVGHHPDDALAVKLRALSVLAPSIEASIASEVAGLRVELDMARADTEDQRRRADRAEEFGRWLAAKFTSLEQVLRIGRQRVAWAEAHLRGIVEAKRGVSLRAIAESYFPSIEEPTDG